MLPTLPSSVDPVNPPEAPPSPIPSTAWSQIPGLPDRWWDLPTEEVAARLDGVNWKHLGQRQRKHSAAMEQLLRHHPSLLAQALRQGLEANISWATPPEVTPHSALWHALHLGTPDAVQALRAKWALLNTQESALTGPLSMTMLHLSRNAAPDSPLARLSPAERFARETDLLERFTAERHGLNEGPPGPEGTFSGDVAKRAARLRKGLPATTLQALIDHGVDLNGPPATQTSTLQELIVLGDATNLDTWLTMGLTLSVGPGDDRAALDVISRVRGHPNELDEAWVARQAMMLDVLHQHGWTAGPRFHAQALGQAVRHGTAPALLEVLTNWGAEPIGVDTLGRNALHHASNLPKSLPNVVPLLAQGLDPMAVDHNGRSALDAARYNAHSYPGAHQAFTAALVAMETAVLRQTLHANGDGASSLAPSTMPEAPRPPRPRL